MKNSELVDLVESFSGVPVLVVGDLIVDHYIWGSVDRISPEAPVVVVQQTDENRRLGGAGNVAHNLVSLGAEVGVCGVVGGDEEGSVLVSMFEDLGVGTAGLVVDESRPTTIKTRVIAGHQQVVRVDRETCDMVSTALQDVLAKNVVDSSQNSKGIIISDYAKGTICPAIFSEIREGVTAGRLGFGKCPILVDPKAPNYPMYRNSTIIKPNRKEAEEASGITIRSKRDAILAGHALLEKWGSEMILITLGELGMVLVSGVDSGENDVQVDTVAREVFDVSGAGDTVASVFLLALAAGGNTRQAAVLANIAAGVVVAEVGTVAVSKDSLLQAIQTVEI